jgi:hypothetical protein
MSTINASFYGTDQAAQQAMLARGPRLLANLIVKVNSLSLRLQSKIVGLLSGPVLNIRTGKLAGSVRVELAHVDGDSLVGGVQGSGGPAWYGRLFIDGGTFQVAEHVRRTGLNSRGQTIRLLTGSGAVARKVASIRTGVVRAHTMTLPQRDWIRPAVAEMTPIIQSEIAQVVAES